MPARRASTDELTEVQKSGICAALALTESTAKMRSVVSRQQTTGSIKVKVSLFSCHTMRLPPSCEIHCVREKALRGRFHVISWHFRGILVALKGFSRSISSLPKPDS